MQMNWILSRRLHSIGLLWLWVLISAAADTHSVRAIVIDIERTKAVADTGNRDSLFVFSDAKGRAVPLDEIEEPTSSRLSRYAAAVLPSVEIPEQQAVIVLNTLLALVNGDPLEKMAHKGGIIRTVKPVEGDILIPEWLSFCDLGSLRITLPETRQVPFLELLYRVAQAVDLDIGLLDTGSVIVGRPSKWHPEYVPMYLMKPMNTSADQSMIPVRHDNERQGTSSEIE